jgi:hypothetical protein
MSRESGSPSSEAARELVSAFSPCHALCQWVVTKYLLCMPLYKGDPLGPYELRAADSTFDATVAEPRMIGRMVAPVAVLIR